MDYFRNNGSGSYVFWVGGTFPIVTVNFEVSSARRLQSTMPRSSSPLLSAILQSKFSGASGSVEFGSHLEKGRNYEGIAVGVFNIQPGAINPETGKRSHGTTLISTWKEENGWVDIPGATLKYRDGTSEFAGTFWRIYDPHYIAPTIRTMGLCLLGIAWLVAGVSMFLLKWLSKSPALRHTRLFLLQALLFHLIEGL